MASAMNEAGAHWVATADRYHGAPDLMIYQTRIAPWRQTISLPGITHPQTPATCRAVDVDSRWPRPDLPGLWSEHHLARSGSNEVPTPRMRSRDLLFVSR
ncbi:hypothetical protein KTR9_4803 (plasmid) [Gordonia sp. KTR9]|nr:hypothetical protein KTR9_4803 [Gordonia sp. KTR9]